jgi:hypothetical protein
VAYLLKSGILRLKVAQYPTLAVTAGQNTDQNCPSLGIPGLNWLGLLSIGPKPPADERAQARRARARPTRIGAEYFSRTRMDSTPLRMMYTWVWKRVTGAGVVVAGGMCQGSLGVTRGH